MKFMKSRWFFAAFLAVVGVLAIAIGAVIVHHNPVSHQVIVMVMSGLGLLAGSTVIQTYPIAGTFPTSQQAVSCNTQIARVVMGDTDTIAVLTHNWGLTAAQAAQFLPLIKWYVENIGATFPPVSFTLTDTNTVSVNKVATTGSGCTLVVALERPLSSTL